MRVRVRGVVATIASLGLLTGCAQEPTPDVSPATAAAVRSLVSAPIELDIAEAYLVNECMSRHGHLNPIDSGSVAVPNADYAIVAGVLTGSEEQHAAAGYSTTVIATASAVDQMLQHMSETERGQYLLDLYGADDAEVTYTGLDGTWTVGIQGEGCLAEAKTQLYGSVLNAAKVQQWPNEFSLGLGSARDTVFAAVGDAMPTYLTCMAGRGHELTGLWASRLAEERFGQYRAEGMPPSSAEASLIRDDHQCQTESGLIQLIDAAALDAAAAWLVKNESAILETQALLQAATERANTVING